MYYTNISNNDIEIDSFSKNIIRKDRNNAGGGLLIYFKDYISVIRKHELEKIKQIHGVNQFTITRRK
jgi:hypothetical protein